MTYDICLSELQNFFGHFNAWKLEAVSVEWLGNTKFRVTLNGEIPERESVCFPTCEKK